MDIQFKLEAFEGPLDLLLHLLEKNKVDIYDIPIAEITDQYMAYVEQMPEEDLGVMSEFLVMAATLLDIKCRMLLPRTENEEGEEEDPRAELVEQLLQYKLYKYMSYQLKDRQKDADMIFYHAKSIPEEVASYEPPVNLEDLLKDLTLERLHEIYQQVQKRQERRMDPVRAKFGRIQKEQVSLDEKMASLKAFAKKTRRFSFRRLLESARSRDEVIVTFLCILEMMHSGEVRIRQEETFGEIEIESQVAA